MRGPIESTAIKSSKLAFCKTSIEPKCFARSLATVTPTNLIPSENKTLSKGRYFDSSKIEIKF